MPDIVNLDALLDELRRIPNKTPKEEPPVWVVYPDGKRFPVSDDMPSSPIGFGKCQVFFLYSREIGCWL